jgi:phosphatidate phosphatase APP1
LGPLLLRDLLGSSAERSHATHKHGRISEVLELHPGLTFVLIGDSGQYDPTIYADVVRRNPGRILAVYIREVRLDPGDRRVEVISESWDEEVPFVLAADSAAVAVHAAGLGLIDQAGVSRVTEATART